MNYLDILKTGGIGVLKTDTLYGIVGRADMLETVERIYNARKRDTKKPCIILISHIQDLEKFSVQIDEKILEILKEVWPGKVSVVLPCESDKYTYLHRGTKTLAFRLPGDSRVIEILKQTGPLLAPSANVQGMPPASMIDEAKKYFEDSVDFYEDSGNVEGKASKLIAIQNGEVITLRP